MTAALIGLLGAVLGLAIGRGYGFWASRRQELAEAAIAAAAVAEELRRGSKPELVNETWRAHRRWLVIHMSPKDYRLLASRLQDLELGLENAADYRLVERIDALYGLFWEEHEAFILIPLIHYMQGNTVSKRVREILDPTLDIATLPKRGSRSALRTWHSPSDPPLRSSGSQPAAPE